MDQLEMQAGLSYLSPDLRAAVLGTTPAPLTLREAREMLDGRAGLAPKDQRALELWVRRYETAEANKRDSALAEGAAHDAEVAATLALEAKDRATALAVLRADVERGARPADDLRAVAAQDQGFVGELRRLAAELEANHIDREARKASDPAALQEATLHRLPSLVRTLPVLMGDLDVKAPRQFRSANAGGALQTHADQLHAAIVGCLPALETAEARKRALAGPTTSAEQRERFPVMDSRT